LATMQRFLSKKDDNILPMANQGTGSPMGTGTAGSSLPKAKPMTIATWVWLIVSVIMILMGGKFAGTSTNIRSLICGPETCEFSIVSILKEENDNIKFSRHNFKSAQQVRVRQKQIRDISKMNRKDIRKLGYSYSVKFIRDGNDEVEEVALALSTLGRKRPGNMVDIIQDYLDGTTSSLEVLEQSGFDVKGLIFILLGVVSCLFCVLIGQFSDPKPRRAVASRVTKKRAY